MVKVAMVSLGCPKNQIDAEMMIYDLRQKGFETVIFEVIADVIIVNTCGFIEDAKREAIETILKLAELKMQNLKALIVTGCLAERYGAEIMAEIPEVDAVVGIGENGRIAEIINDTLAGKGGFFAGNKYDLSIDMPRVVSTPKYTAYVKIAEGCDNCCTYCAIPLIRGRFRSRKIENILAEIADLAENGVKEVILVAQDTTRYGEDIYGTSKLPELIRRAAQISGIEWIRTLYTYPERITDELIKTVAEVPQAVKYFDIPIQHCSGEILKRMNRTGNRETLTALMRKLRKNIPGVTLRTTLITGFPGETEAQFEELCDFVNDIKFDRLGCFAYSEEEGTVAAGFKDQIEPQLRADRAEIIMNDQLRIVIEKNRAKIDTVQRVMVEGLDGILNCYVGRTEADAPEIDGRVYFTSPKKLNPGTFLNVAINDTVEYDLLGEED